MCCILRASSLVTAIYNGPTQTDGGIQNNFSRFFFAATQRDCLDIALIMCVYGLSRTNENSVDKDLISLAFVSPSA